MLFCYVILLVLITHVIILCALLHKSMFCKRNDDCTGGTCLRHYTHRETMENGPSPSPLKQQTLNYVDNMT